MKKFNMAVLDIQHIEWTNFKFGGAQKVKVTFKAEEGMDKKLYKLDWKLKSNAEEFTSKTFSNQEEIEIESNNITAKATLLQGTNLHLQRNKEEIKVPEEISTV